MDEITRYCRESTNLHVHLMGNYARDLSGRDWTDERKVAKFRDMVRDDLKRFIGCLRRTDDDSPCITRLIGDVRALRELDDFISTL